MYLVDLRIEWEQERVLVDAAVARLIKQVQIVIQIYKGGEVEEGNLACPPFAVAMST